MWFHCSVSCSVTRVSFPLSSSVPHQDTLPPPSPLRHAPSAVGHVRLSGAICWSIASYSYMPQPGPFSRSRHVLARCHLTAHLSSSARNSRSLSLSSGSLLLNLSEAAARRGDVGDCSPEPGALQEARVCRNYGRVRLKGLISGIMMILQG